MIWCQPILPAAGKGKPHSKREYLSGAPQHPLQRDSKEEQAYPYHRTLERLRTDDAGVSEGKWETWGWKQWHCLNVYTRGPRLSSTMVEDWRFTMQGNLTRQVPGLETLNMAGVSWEAPENGRGEDSSLKMGNSTFWVVSSPAPFPTLLTEPQWSHLGRTDSHWTRNSSLGRLASPRGKTYHSEIREFSNKKTASQAPVHPNKDCQALNLLIWFLYFT